MSKIDKYIDILIERLYTNETELDNKKKELNDKFKNKYLKYKAKYLELKKIEI